jgi:hypothetical protein
MFASVLRCLTGERDSMYFNFVLQNLSNDSTCVQLCLCPLHPLPGWAKRDLVYFVLECKFVPNRWLSANTFGFSYSAPFASITIFGLHTNKLQNQNIVLFGSTRLFVSTKTCFCVDFRFRSHRRDGGQRVDIGCV